MEMTQSKGGSTWLWKKTKQIFKYVLIYLLYVLRALLI